MITADTTIATALDFTQRSGQDELMDTEPVAFGEFEACLKDLAWVNRVTGAYGPTLGFFDRLRGRCRGLGRPLRVLDVGSGHGDMLRHVDRWARVHGVEVALTGIDLNPSSRRAAMAATPVDREIHWVTADAFDYAPAAGVDVVISSLFTHHLADPQVVRFVAWMESTARVGWFVNDLHRHPVPYHVFRVASRLARLHRFVQHDGPVSIARAFVPDDWRRIVAAAGMDPADVDIRWRMPFRLTVARVKSR